jgi:hypothetical protein
MSAKIAAALHEVMSKVGYVQKTGKNDFHGYRYAGEAKLLETLRPALVEAGLLLIPSAEVVSPADAHGNVTVRIAYTIAHKDGDVWPYPVYAVGCGNDRAKNGNIGDKGVYKALTGANKYLLFKLFQIETGDDPEKDDDAEHAPSFQKMGDAVVKGFEEEFQNRAEPVWWREMKSKVSKARSRQKLDEIWADYAETCPKSHQDAMWDIFTKRTDEVEAEAAKGREQTMEQLKASKAALDQF